jgi:hypothetical protein
MPDTDDSVPDDNNDVFGDDNDKVFDDDPDVFNDADDSDDDFDDDNVQGEGYEDNDAFHEDGAQVAARGAPLKDAVAARGAPVKDADNGAPPEAVAEQVTPVEDAAQGAPVETVAHEAHFNLRPRNTFQIFSAGDRCATQRQVQFRRQLTQQGYTLMQHPLGRGRRFTLNTPSNFTMSIFGYVMNQMTAKAGIKKHGKAAKAAFMNEFAQMEELSVYKSVDPKTLTSEQQRGALRAINLIKEKRDGNLKGRTVADGRPLRLLYKNRKRLRPRWRRMR